MAVYGGLIKTEGGSNVNWMKDGERYSKIEKNAEGAYEVTAYKALSPALEFYPARGRGAITNRVTACILLRQRV